MRTMVMDAKDSARKRTKDQPAPAAKAPSEKIVVPLQLGRFVDSQGRLLQDRFEVWGREAADALTAVNKNGDPIFDAGKTKAKFRIEIELERLANDSFSFTASVQTKSNLPHIPFRGKSTVFTTDDGLIEKISPDENYLFDPNHGQPQLKTAAEAAADLADDDDDAADGDDDTPI